MFFHHLLLLAIATPIQTSGAIVTLLRNGYWIDALICGCWPEIHLKPRPQSWSNQGNSPADREPASLTTERWRCRKTVCHPLKRPLLVEARQYPGSHCKGARCHLGTTAELWQTWSIVSAECADLRRHSDGSEEKHLEKLIQTTEHFIAKSLTPHHRASWLDCAHIYSKLWL